MQVGDLGYAQELGNYAEYSGAPNEEETLQYARALIDVSFSSCQLRAVLTIPLQFILLSENGEPSFKLILF